jgi:hypothetical protein
MALALNDRVKQTGTANTTVSFTLSGSSAGFQSFAVIGNGNTTYYAATDASGNWEVGIGTYSTTGPTLTRTTILSSSNAGSAVTFSGTVDVWVTYPSEKSINYDADGVAVIGDALGYADTGIIASFASTVAGYNQVVLQNKSTATNASSNLNVSNNASTASTGFAELGINSTTFSNGAGCFNIPGASYVASAGTDLSIGTYGAYDIHFATNSNTTDSMTIHDGGGVSLGGYGDPGLGNIAVNKAVPGFTSITSAAGVTTLVAASTYYQRVVGTSTQTIQLPDATTLLNGTTFIIDNSSTQSVTITDGATTTIDTAVAGSLTYIYLINNSTLAGTWAKNHFLPSSYDFGASTANFGAVSITNATWTGNTIATGYGGTGLTTFTAANNAIYSTSSSALAAGTLPTAAGGTALTSFTSGGAMYATSTSALTTGTLPIASGGTGLTSTPANGALDIGNGTGFTRTTLTPGTGISITNGSGSISIASTITSGVTVTDDTSTATAIYPTLTSATSGSVSGLSVTSTKFKFVPSTGTMTASNLEAANGMITNSQTVTTNYSIPSGSNAIAVGPVTVAGGATVTIPSGSRWLVL